ncbi:hypothetical protein KBA27_06050 [bacterium]|nr:hypothetical protein [bacterium]
MIKRIIFATLAIILFFNTPCFALTALIDAQTRPQYVAYNYCNKIFKMDSQRLFYLTLASISANRFTIDEIQSRSGYVLFTVKDMHFLASVINVDSKRSMLKITPTDSNYYFPIGIVQNCFKYIELNQYTPVERPLVQ